MWIIQSILLSISLAMDAFALSLGNGLSDKKMKTRRMLLMAGSFGLFQGVMPLIGFAFGSIFETWIQFAIPAIGFCILTYLGVNMIVNTIKENKHEQKELEKQQSVNSSNLETQSLNTPENLEIESSQNLVENKSENLSEEQSDKLYTDSQNENPEITSNNFQSEDISNTSLDLKNEKITLTSPNSKIENDSPSNLKDESTTKSIKQSDKQIQKTQNNQSFTLKLLFAQSIATSIDALTVGIVYIGSDLIEVFTTFFLIAIITFAICFTGIIIGKKFGDKLKSKSGILGGSILCAIAIKILIEFLISII